MTVYQDIIWGISLCAGLVTCVFLALVIRRLLSERNRVRRDKRDTEITRDYLQRVAGHRVENIDRWHRKSRLRAISRMFPLLRGGERTRMLQIAELDGVLGETLRVSHGMRKADRIDAIQALQRFGSEVCIGRLREMMANDRNPRVRLEAAFALGANNALPPPRETLRVLKALNRSPTRLDIALLRSSAPLYPEQMLLLLEDDLCPAWRAQIVEALGWTESAAVIEALDNAAIHSDPEVRCAAMRASGQLGHPAARYSIILGLSDTAPMVRLQAIAACVRVGLGMTLPAINRLRNDPELWVRLRAEQAIEQMAPAEDTTPHLRAAA